MDTCIVGQQTGSWTGHTVQKWHANLHRHVPGKLTSFSETTTNPLGGSNTIQYSGITATKGPQEDSRQARNLGRSLPADIIPASEIAAMIWAMQPFHILQSVLTSNGWQNSSNRWQTHHRRHSLVSTANMHLQHAHVS